MQTSEQIGFLQLQCPCRCGLQIFIVLVQFKSLVSLAQRASFIPTDPWLVVSRFPRGGAWKAGSACVITPRGRLDDTQAPTTASVDAHTHTLVLCHFGDTCQCKLFVSRECDWQLFVGLWAQPICRCVFVSVAPFCVLERDLGLL